MINLELHPRQSACFLSPATEILYGGAAGGGKSHTMRVIAIILALDVPNIQIYLFRRVFADLSKNHIEGASGFAALLAPLIQLKYVRISESEITFKNGSKIYLCHCQHEKDVIKYQGAEINVLLIDELTHFSEKIYKFLRGRCRIGSLVVPEKYKAKLPLIICGSNPGGVGHQFVKETFIDNCKPMQVRQMSPEEGGMLRQFIPARLEDNPTMIQNDPFYANKLIGLGGALAKAMLDGDWDAIEGCYFDQFNKDIHVIEPFLIPPDWARIRGFDWGYSKPFATLWAAVSDGSSVMCGGVKRSFPRGSLIFYREYYGCTGKANEGLKISNQQIAEATMQMQEGEKMSDMVADPAIFDVSRGKSIAEEMANFGCHYREADNKRINGWQQIRGRLIGQDGKPLIYFTKDCKNLLRTLPIMQYDPSKPEDLDSDLEDHACFIGSTLVDTDKGKIQIKDLDPNLHKIMAGDKWTNEYFPSITKEKAKTIKLTFENGVSIYCTPEHKILDNTDTWRYARDFLNIEALWNQQLSATQYSITGVKTIISAVIIFKKTALDFIDWFGKMQMARYLKAITYIIKMRIEQITNSKILNVLLRVIMPNFILMKRRELNLERMSRKLSRLLSCGIRAKKEESGIKNTGRKIAKLSLPKRLLPKNVITALKNITLFQISRTTANSVGIIAKRVRCVSVEDWKEEPVYCLFEPKTNSFTIEEGLIVHNCDTLRYICMSRPIVVNITPTPSEIGEQWWKDFNPHNVRKQLLKRENLKNYE